MTDSKPSGNRLGVRRRDELSKEAAAAHDDMMGFINERSGFADVVENFDASGRLIGPFGSFLHTPPVWYAFHHMAGAVIGIAPQMPARFREIALNVVVMHQRAAYPVYAHRLLGERDGITKEQLDVMERGEKPDGLGEDGDVAWELARALVTKPGPLDDELWQHSSELLGRDATMRLIHEIGLYQYVGIFLNGFDARDPSGKHWDRESSSWKA